MGGVDGKNWGVYTATVPAGSSIQPDGDVSTWTGMINDDHRIVFMTSGCGAWTAS